MAITGVSSISGEQIIAAGALSARSAATALYDENGNAITSYLTAVPEGYATTGDLNDLVTSISETYQPTAGMTAYQSAGDYYSASNPSGFISEVPTGTMNESAFGYDSDNKISSYNGSAIGGSAPTYGYTDNDLINSIDTSGLYATSAGTAATANHLNQGGTMGGNILQTSGSNSFYYMPIFSPWTTADVATGIFAPLQYTTGACLGMQSNDFRAYFKGNEWFVSNRGIGQALRGEVHAARGVHISGATTAGYGFNLGINNVNGVNSLGSWKYGHAEDAALRAVSSCDMHESAFEYDANDKISGYNGSAFAGGSDVPEGVMVESGLEYNAVNEISGYNGSAIAQYGAEKQWLVHDDTLVHAANSAQYALGVNLSAVAQLLGIDRTLLWSGSKGSVGDVIDLTEALSSFNKVEFIINEGNTAIPLHSFTSNTDGTLLYPYFVRTNSNNAELCNLWSLNRQNNDTRLSVVISVLRTNGTTSGSNGSKFNEIWGIGRKQ